ncbi:MAG: hypothetical protein ACI4I7_01110 [Oscillospiraceae bacterium]
MKKGTKALLIISIIFSIAVAANFLTDIFSTKLNKYYKVDCS